MSQWHFECRETSAYFSLWPNPDQKSIHPMAVLSQTENKGFQFTYMEPQGQGCSMSKETARDISCDFSYHSFKCFLKLNGSQINRGVCAGGGSRHRASVP